MIGEKTAEDLKINIGSAFKNSRNLTCMMKGRNLVTGLPDEVEIGTEQIRNAIKEPVDVIVETVKKVLERTPPELASDIIERGILMTGGGALIHGLDKLIEFRTGVSTTVAEDSVECVAKGTGKVLNYIDKLNNEVNSQQIVLIE
jgi:rod shape-determining protein MreB